MFYPNTVWNSGNPVLDSAGQRARKFVAARGLQLPGNSKGEDQIKTTLASVSAPAAHTQLNETRLRKTRPAAQQQRHHNKQRHHITHTTNNDTQ